MNRRKSLPIPMLSLLGSTFTFLSPSVSGKQVSTVARPRMVQKPHPDSGYPLNITEAEVFATTHEGKIQRSQLLGLIFKKMSQRRSKRPNHYRSVKMQHAAPSPVGGVFSRSYSVEEGCSGLYVYMIYNQPLSFHDGTQHYSERYEAALVISDVPPCGVKSIRDLPKDRNLCMHHIDQRFSLAPDLNLHFAHTEGIPSQAKTAQEVHDVFHKILRKFMHRMSPSSAGS